MDGEAGLTAEHSRREKKRSYRTLVMNEEELEEPHSDLEECGTVNLYKKLKNPFHKRRCHSGKVESELVLYGAESPSFFSTYPACAPQDTCALRGRGDEAGPSSMLEYWVCLDNQPNMAECIRTITPPASPIIDSLCPAMRVPSPVAASTVTSPTVTTPTIDTCSPISSMCIPRSSAWDPVRSTSRTSGCSEWDPVGPAAHLHLLGESLSLIGLRLQETNKLVSLSNSFSLLLDSLVCALAPLTCLTLEIPELGNCTQHTLASTLENIAYVMPGM